MSTNMQGEKRFMIMEIQEMILAIGGKRDLMLDRPDQITVRNLQKLHTLLKGVKDGMERIEESTNEWRKTLAEGEAKLGSILKG